MDRILKGQFQDWKSSNFVLILVPTRELAEQVYENVVKFSEFSGLKGISVYGGTGYDKQKEGFRNNVEFVVATPGRLIDLFKEHHVDLKQVRAIVFDEADRMFDMGFKDDMKFILQRVPRERQFLVFSATLNFDVLNTAYQFGADPVEINISRDQAKAENVKDEIFHVGQDDKPVYLLSLLKKHSPKQVIVFSNFKNNVERISQFLSLNGVPAMGISSLLTQVQRNRVLELFKADNEKNVLVATDVAARGLDIKGVDMVINFELPMDAESYVHRIGRTGRAGTEGKAFSLVSDRDVDSLKRVEDYLKHKLATGWLEDVDMVTEFKPFPSDRPQRSEKPFRSHDRPFDKNGPRRDSRSSGPRRDGRPAGGPRRDRPERGPRAENPGSPQAGSVQRPNQGRSKAPHSKSAQNSPNSGPQRNEGRRAQNSGPGSQRRRSSNGAPPPRQNPSATLAKKPAVAAKPQSKITGLLKKIFSLGSK